MAGNAEHGLNARVKSPLRSQVIIKLIQPGPQYSRGVRIGNWVEDLIECPKGGSLYIAPKEDIDYEKMKPETRSLDLRQNKLVGVQGLGLYTVIRHDSHTNCGNYTTTTDLVYNHMPKPLCGPVKRYYKKSKHNWYPQPDLMHCYGDNLTKTGYRDEKRLEWKFTDVSDYNSTFYEDTYTAPGLDQYLKAAERRARNSSFTKTFRFKMTKPLTKPKKK